MNHLKVTILIVAAVWVFVSSTTTSYAEQRAIGPKQIQKSVPVAATQAPATSNQAISNQAISNQAIKPLQQSLILQGALPPLICPSLVATINDVIKISHTDIPKAVQMYLNQGNIYFPGTSENVAGVYRSYVQDCCSPNKSFSVQYQKNAGCAGSDSVNLCMDKVIKHCISQYPEKYSLKYMLGDSRGKATVLIQKTGLLHDKINQLDEMIP